MMLGTQRTGATLVEVFGGDPPAEVLTYVALNQIVPSRWQPRKQFDAERLLELAQDIRTRGLLNPLLVWINEDGEYELIAGERRLRSLYALVLRATDVAANTYRGQLDATVNKLARGGFAVLRGLIAERVALHECPLWLRTVACRIVVAPPDQLHEMALVDNLQRADLGPLEEAHALQDLITEHGYTQRDLAERVGKSQTWVAQRLVLLKLDTAVANQVVAGEVDAATAREVARLDPAVQPAAVEHLRKHGLKSKAAQNLVQRVIEFSDPARWEPAADAGNVALRRLARLGLERLDAPGRQAALVRYAGEYPDGRIGAEAKDEYAVRRLIVQTGLAAISTGVYGGLSLADAWAANAPAAGWTCATCRLNAQREDIADVTTLALDRSLYVAKNDVRWPQCAPGRETCPAYTPADRPVRLPLPYLDDLPLTPAERGHVVDRNDAADDVATWSAIIRRKLAREAQRAAEETTRKETGVATALTGYIAAQDSIMPEHFLSQPCSRCIFQRPGEAAPCQHVAQPPVVQSYDPVVARTWRSGEIVIGRCRFFRLRAPHRHLPDLPGAGPALTPAAVLVLLESLALQDYSSKRAPGWLDAKRPDNADGPAWGEAETILQKLLPTLTPGQRLALVYLWLARFDFHRGSLPEASRVEAFAPDLDRVVSWEIDRDFTA